MKKLNEKSVQLQDTEKQPKEKRAGKWILIAVYLMLFDAFAVNFSYFFGLWLRFDFRYNDIPELYLEPYKAFAPIYTVCVLVVFYLLYLYKSLWRFASMHEMNRIICASAITTVLHIAGITIFYERMPLSYYIIGAIVQFFLVTAVRFCYRFVTMYRSTRRSFTGAEHNVMVIGAGDAGRTIILELMRSSELSTKVCCVIDDDPNKHGFLIEGVPIVGGRDYILAAAEKYDIDQIMFAIPTATAQDKRDILNICKETTCEVKSLPGIYQLANGEVSLNSMKAVAVEDLLGREPVKVDNESILQTIKGKTVLVTGGGGSIGSELCRQIASHEPGLLIIFDIYENNAYEIEQELRRKYGDALNLLVLIGSVRDTRRIEMVFERYRPQIVYHAAAHKHVPLMETSPNEAIKNNAIGTYKTAHAALHYGAERFVLISTDKAVNPTNIMGASKRLCEMVIQSMDAISKAGREELLPRLQSHGVEDRKQSVAEGITIDCVSNAARTGTQFVAVRFGNVLGSNGSVIPLFKKQIADGGPVTVTHPDIVRYFMTIPEAASLVLQAGSYAWGGEIFVLDMGDPVKIDTLARNLIKLSGLEPDVDIPIVYTGLRSGEKLFEEKLMAEEGMRHTANALIHIGKPIPFNVDEFLNQLAELSEACCDNRHDIVELVEKMVPTFHPVGEHPTGKENVTGIEEAMAEAAVTSEEK